MRGLFHTAASPSEAGVLRLDWYEPQPTKKASRKGFTGSVEIKDLLALRETEAVAEAAKTAEKADKAAAASAKQIDLENRAGACVVKCVCVLTGRQKCKNAKVAQCPVCRAWKDGKCIKKACLGEVEDDAAEDEGPSQVVEGAPHVDIGLEYASSSDVCP